MPITIKTGNVKYKSNVTGNYVGINAVSDNATADQIEDIEDAGTAQVAAVEAKGAEVRESIPEEYTELTNDVTNLKSAVNELDEDISDLQSGKVNKPVTSPNGISGQFLKTNGDGTTIWDDPISEPVSEAVAEWLEEHPEATTTVEDGSLTYAKLLKGTLGYVIPQQFGAKGDGVTDDTQALKDCIDYAMENNYSVRLPMGTYSVMWGELSFTLSDGQSLVITGEGQNSIIKLKNDSLPAPKESGNWWCQIFTIEVDSNIESHAKDVIFSDFCIDGNRRNQSELINMEDADTTYMYEPSAAISFRSANESISEAGERYIDRAIIKNMRFYDPVADCVNIPGSASYPINCIRDVFIDNMVATDRHGTRNDIGFTGSPMHAAFITNCDVGSIHFEFNGTPSSDDIIPVMMNSCNFGEMTLGARIDLIISSCNIGLFLIGGFRKALISSCNIKLSSTAYAVYSIIGECYIHNCIFTTTTNPTSTDGSVYKFIIREAKKVVISNCDFMYEGELTVDKDNDQVYDHAIGEVIYIENGIKTPVLIDGCRFDQCFEYVFRHYSNNLTLRNMTIGTMIGWKAIGTSTSGKGYLSLENIKASDTCLSFGELGSIQGGAIECNGAVEVQSSNFKTQAAITYARTWMTNNTGDLHRVTKINSPLDYTTAKSVAGMGTGNRTFLLFKNDTFIYDGANKERYPTKWIVKDTGETAYNSSNVVTTGTDLKDRLISIGSGYGATADRPTCYLSPGFEFFDTTLGKKIIWNGTTWVNCDGTAL